MNQSSDPAGEFAAASGMHDGSGAVPASNSFRAERVFGEALELQSGDRATQRTHRRPDPPVRGKQGTEQRVGSGKMRLKVPMRTFEQLGSQTNTDS